MVWSDDTEKFTLSAPSLNGKRIVICHAGSTKNFVSNSLLLCEEMLSESHADFQDDMNGDIFEDWFENTLLKNLL